MAAHSPTGHDFDHWARLAREDPASFETERARVLETAIRHAPPEKQPRLRCLQWKLDRIRATSATPLLASLRINRLLWESFAGKHGLVERLNCLQTPDRQGPPRASAEILRFPD